MPLESTQPHGHCWSSCPLLPPLDHAPHPPSVWALHACGPLSFTASSTGLLSQTRPQRQVHDGGSTSVPIFKGLSKLLESCPPQGDAVGWKGPGGQAQTPVRPVGVKPQFCSPTDHDSGQVTCLSRASGLIITRHLPRGVRGESHRDDAAVYQ